MDTIAFITVGFLTVLSILLVFLLIGGIIYQESKGKVFKRLYHDKLDWHIAKPGIYRNEDISVCAVCGKLIYESKDGSWVTTSKF